MSLVDIKTLAPVLIKNNLLTSFDIEFLQLQTIIDSEKVYFIYVKLLRCGREGYKRLMECLQDSYSMEHIGHEELYQKLSASQQ